MRTQPELRAVTEALTETASACSVTVPTADDFFHTYASTLCQSLEGCCNTGPAFDMAGCLSLYAVPGSGGLLGVGQPSEDTSTGKDGIRFHVRMQSASVVSTLNCGSVLEDTLNSIQQKCTSAVHGTVAITSVADGGDAEAPPACASSYECVSGGFCTKNTALSRRPTRASETASLSSRT